MSKNKRRVNTIDLMQEKFLINHYRKEWESSEIKLRKHELVQQTRAKLLKSGELALAALMAGGFLTLALVAPNVLVAFYKMGKQRRFFREENINKKVREFSSRSYFHYRKISADEYAIALTGKGRKLAHKFAVQHFKLHPQKVWDGKWRMITFDIDRKNSGARDALRFKLRQIGALAIQESVFIYPYHCYEEITFWSSFFCIEKCVYYAEVNNIFNEHHPIEKNLKEHFGLV